MRIRVVLMSVLAATFMVAHGQTPVSQVVMSSMLTQQRQVQTVGDFVPTSTAALPKALLDIYGANDPTRSINDPLAYRRLNQDPLTSAINTNIAVSLSSIPLSSPTSGVIVKKDPSTGAELPVSGTLGPIFTQRAETVGRGSVYLGFTHQNYHFTSLDGYSLNGLPVAYGGGQTANTKELGALQSSPATINFALDVRLVQDIAFLTFGLTNRFDVSVGLPAVHASVASTAYNAQVYSGTGQSISNGNNCWCASTFTPGSVNMAIPAVGTDRASKSGFGDLLLRFKGGVFQKPSASLAVGVDLRLPTGDEENYLGTGTTSVKPFIAVSLYTPKTRGIVLAPHFEAGWQFSGKSVLGGTLVGTAIPVTIGGGQIQMFGAPFTSTKDFLPDIFSWGVGTEIAFGRSNTAVVDFVGNQIGIVHGVPTLRAQGITGPSPTFGPGSGAVQHMSTGVLGAGTRGSYGQYSGAFGYKVRIAGNLVATAQALVRFDSNGLTARVTPLYGIGYSFGR